MRPVLALLVAIAALAVTAPARAGDPYLRWSTLTTPHFRVTYHGGLDDEAQRVGNLAESIHQRLAAHLNWAPDSRTEILLTDDTDSANGSATVLPYNLVRMYISAPDDMSPLGDYEDWLLGLLTHEYTHVLHLDNISGVPALINAILGKTYAPNQVQPRWVIEGLAVAMESEHTSAGRLRSSQFTMYLRADVIEDRLATLDQMSNPARRWPSGNLWYLYGGNFVDWIASVYGPDTFAAVAADYGANPIPWGINRAIRRATGRTYLELYDGWKAHLTRTFSEQLREVERRGLREGEQLTHRGRVAASPRFAPRCARAGAADEIWYFRDDGDTTAGFYRLPLDASGRARESDAELVSRSDGHSASFDGECGLLFDAVAPSRRRYYFNDLFRQPRGTTAPRGIERSRKRLTVGARARDPDVSPDGHYVTYATNRGGTSTLRIAELDPSGSVANVERLVPSARYEQAYTPRFSPDGRQVAYSAWTRGGFRDVRIVDVTTGSFVNVTHDRALDQQPSWSRDGQRVFFTSDRTGIANVYAYDVATRRLSQVTNVRTGAYMPEVSPDGRTLVYVGYTSRGFDLFRLPLDETRWLPALPPPDGRPGLQPEYAARRWPVEPYSPWRTLRPRAYSFDYVTGPFGNAFRVGTGGSDIAGYQGIAALFTLDTEQGEPSGYVSYAYRRLPFVLRATVSRSTAPRRGYRYGDQEPVFVERFTGATSGAIFTVPGEYDAQSVALTYTFGHYDSKLPVGAVADPFSLVSRTPHQGVIATTRLGWSYSNVDSTAYGISSERGFAISAGLDYADKALGSDDTLIAVSASAVGYVPLPWAQHHVLAVGASGATAGGTYPRRGLYYTGGYSTELAVLDAYTSGIQQSGFVLRGFAAAQFIGQAYNLLNFEYRFPIVYVDRGVSTLPVFLRSLAGAAFLDYGGAYNYDEFELKRPFARYHGGVGAELWVDLVLGYYVDGILRLGVAKGLDHEAPDGIQTYFVASAPF